MIRYSTKTTLEGVLLRTYSIAPANGFRVVSGLNTPVVSQASGPSEIWLRFKLQVDGVDCGPQILGLAQE